MGWFWADGPQAKPVCHHDLRQDGRQSPPSADDTMKAPAACPVKHDKSSSSDLTALLACPVPHGSNNAASELVPKSTLSKLNPLNYMFPDLSQKPAPEQTHYLPTSREPSTIPKGDGEGNWEYPSPQQMYNALLRKGYTDTDVTAVESMVSVHNFLNEGAWNEILQWEKRFSGGFYRGWQLCSRGENHFEDMVRKHEYQKEMEELSPSLVRFQGRPKDMTPKATMIQVMGWLYPAVFGTEPPFDRHDWYVTRDINGQRKEIRYVIDYYSGGEDEVTGEPVFYLDVRPAMTPSGALERGLRWGCDVWWKASGGDVREQEKREKRRSS